jgi:hypothetical protein
MKSSQLARTTLALAVAACVTALFLVNDSGAGSAAKSGAACSASGQCTGAQAAACKASGMKCPVTGASAAAFTLVSTGSAHAASGGSCCGSQGAAASSRAGGAEACRGEGLVKVAEASNHSDCDGCADMSRCAQEIAVAGGRVQVVNLKNGVMYVYTAESSAGVRAVQAAVLHRNERIAAWTTAGDQVKLCSACKLMRGAAASGKLSREVVNIEGGCLTLMTSSDPAIVGKLHEMAVQTAAHTKS